MISFPYYMCSHTIMIYLIVLTIFMSNVGHGMILRQMMNVEHCQSDDTHIIFIRFVGVNR